jgi:hypothetical protein
VSSSAIYPYRNYLRSTNELISLEGKILKGRLKRGKYGRWKRERICKRKLKLKL